MKPCQPLSHYSLMRRNSLTEVSSSSSTSWKLQASLSNNQPGHLPRGVEMYKRRISVTEIPLRPLPAGPSATSVGPSPVQLLPAHSTAVPGQCIPRSFTTGCASMRWPFRRSPGRCTFKVSLSRLLVICSARRCSCGWLPIGQSRHHGCICLSAWSLWCGSPSLLRGSSCHQ